MLNLAIARREMLVLAKSPAAFRRRVTTGIVVLIPAVAFVLFYQYSGMRSAMQVISAVTFIVVTMCMFMGAQLTADSIASEKREGTLGLLFMTGLRPIEIAAGKLIAHGTLAVYTVLLGFPLASMVLIAGGIQFGDLLTFAIYAINGLFISACVGLWASSWSTDRRKAATRATWIISIFWWGIPVLLRALAARNAPAWLLNSLALFSLTPGFGPVFIPVTRTLPVSWVNVLCTHLVGWLFFALAVYLLPRRWQDAPPRARFSFAEWRRRVVYGGGKKRVIRRRELLAINPFLWLACRARFRSLGIILFTLVILGIAVATFLHPGTEFGILVTFSVIASFSHVIMAASAGSSQILVEHDQGTLEMLLSTPLSAREIVRGQFRAALRQFTAPVLLTLAFQWLVIAMLLQRNSWSAAAGLTGAGPAALLGLFSAYYVFFLFTAIWLSMWGAVLTGHAKRTSGAAVARLLILPAMIFVAGGAILWGLEAGLGTRVNLPARAIVAIWCALALANNLFWIYRVRARLPHALRMLALRRYMPEPVGAFGVMGGFLGTLVAKFSNRRRRAARPAALGASIERI